MLALGMYGTRGIFTEHPDTTIATKMTKKKLTEQLKTNCSNDCENNQTELR